jgi:hypothetical protein
MSSAVSGGRTVKSVIEEDPGAQRDLFDGRFT